MLETRTDEQLMSIFCNDNDINNARAFETLYQRHKGPLFRFIKKSINNEQDCHETFQELWFKVINNKTQFNPNHKFTTWIYTIARRMMIDVFRKSGRMSELTACMENELQDMPLKQPENEFETKQMGTYLQTAIMQLPTAQRQTFILRHDAGFTLNEIAEITEQAIEKTKSQYRYAVKKLKLSLERFK